MADMLKITALVNPKNYSMPSRPLAQSDAVFNLVDLTKVIKPNDQTSEFRQTDTSTADENASLLTNMELNISKNPLFSASVLKGLVSEDFINQILQSNSPDIINEFNEFAKSIFLESDGVFSDLISQQKGATSFNGDLFDLLRQLSSQNSSPETKMAIAQFLKSTFALQSQNSVLNSLSTNFIYLSQALYPSRSLSEKLEQMAKLFSNPNSSINFTDLKSQALTLLNSVSNSLIATDEIKNLVALIKYNLSRFSDNTTTFENNFNSILDLITNDDVKELLKSAFSKFIQSNSIPELSKRALTADNENFSQADKTTFKLAEMASENEKLIVSEKFSNNLNFVSQQLAKILDDSGKHPTISLANGTTLLKDMLNIILPNNSQNELANFIDNFSQTKDLNALVSRLSYILNSIENYEIKSSLSKVMNELLTALSHSDDVIYQQPTSMDYLSDFLSKTLNNENIAHLGIVDPNTLVHSMLTAPGVFTPLLHYILPVQIYNIKAFGEAWIDNKVLENGSGSNDSNHIFLTFDIEHIGVFELEMFSNQQQLDVNLFCPHGLEKFFSKLSPSFNNIAAKAGYTISSSSIKPLIRLRNLVEVFPRIAERRAGLNVKI